MPADPLWYKDAIIYELHVKAFFDSNDDGVGDFLGLTQKLDYLEHLGITAIWLLPFYPSPLRDDGYDTADYRSVNPSYGSMRSFRLFLREARRRGLRVITELVVNHTSDQHPWFQRARRARPGSARRDFYVWSDTDQRYQGTRVIFNDTEGSNWAWDPVAQAYYWHRFFSHQPDLNFDNPRVLDAIIRTMRYWLDMGVDGLRLDAIPYLCEREGTSCENLPETHAVIRKLRAALDERYADRMFLAEANQWPEDVLPYFGDGDECHMGYHFPLMPRIYMALAQEDRHPVTDIMRQTPEIPERCQWAIFLRNHDELTLEMVSDRERDYLWQFYATDPRARLNLGIRRRLAPLLENDRRKIELLNGLLMSMPGTPIVYYGDEIGMGDNIFLGDRDGVRTPMQWTPDRNGGFSRADPARLYLPPIMDSIYGFEALNVEAQGRAPASLLNWMRRLIAVRRQHRSFGRGSIDFLLPGNRKILAYLRVHEGEVILCVANLSRSPQPVELDLSAFKGRVPIELIGRSPFPPIGELPYLLTLAGYGFYWFLLAEEANAPSWHESLAPPVPELFTLVIPGGWRDVTAGKPGRMLESRVLPGFLANQRWFAAKDRAIGNVALDDWAEINARGDSWALALFGVAPDDRGEQRYCLPLAIAWEQKHEDPLLGLLPWALARVRQGPRLGVLYDGAADPGFARALVGLMSGGREVAAASGGRLQAQGTAALAALAAPEELAAAEVQRLGQEQSNTSVLVGGQMILKVYRRLQAGIHPELEIGRHLTEEAGYANAPAFLGAVEHVDAAGERTALAVLQRFVRNQGDGWSYVANYLDRVLEDAELLPPGTAVGGVDRHVALANLLRGLGVRVAELHRAFAIKTSDPAFRPQPVTRRDLAGWKRQIGAEANAALKLLHRGLAGMPPHTRELAERLLRQRARLRACIAELTPDRLDAVKTRLHGDLHLGQVVVVRDDFFILDFEGEPARPMAERRSKSSPLRDLAGMLRSFNYAAWAAVHKRAAANADLAARLLPEALEWERQVAAAFRDGYRQAIGDCPSYPADAAAARRLLALFLLEKALYEVRYEAANRPGWLAVPLNGVLDLLEAKE